MEKQTSQNGMENKNNENKNVGKEMEASLSILVMSIASSCIMAMGLAANPSTGKVEKNKEIARFNIDLLVMLQSKTKNNLTAEEQKLLTDVVKDLQMKFVTC